VTNIIEFKSDKTLDFYVDQIKRVLDARGIVIATINDDGTFGTFVENEIVDIELCYLIDCLKERRRQRNGE
jgi:hypothetical protein